MSGERRNLEKLLQTAYDLQHNPTKVPVKKQKESQKSPASQIDRLAEHFRTIEAVAFVLAIGAILMEHYFWWFVAFTYIGLVIQIFLSFTAGAGSRLRYLTAIFFIGVFTLFTVKVVIGQARLDSSVQWTKGNYDPGTDIHGLTWKNNWSELTLSIFNNSNTEFKELDMEFLVDGRVAALKQVEGLQCTTVRNGPNPEVTITNENGQQSTMNVLAYQGSYRLLCDKIPRGTGITIIVALINTQPLEDSMFNGKKHLDSLIGPKRKPKWVVIHAEYKAGMRPYVVESKKEPTEY